MRIRGITFVLLLAATSARSQNPTLESGATAILGRRCLSCHDSITKTAGLDLSRRETALAGGKSGLALVPGDIEHSLIAKKVTSGQMPVGTPLPQEERAVI